MNNLINGINWNYWYFCAPLMAVAMVFVGTAKSRLGKRFPYRIYDVDSRDTVIKTTSVVFTIVLHALFLLESIHGILQFVMDPLHEDEYGWLPILVAILLVASFFLFMGFFYYAGKLGQRIVHRVLVFLKKRELKKELETDVPEDIDELDEEDDPDEEFIRPVDLRKLLKGENIIYFKPNEKKKTPWV